MRAAILSLALLLTMLTTGVAQKKPAANEVSIHHLSRPETLNLITATDAASQEIHNQMYETLTITDPYTLETIPWLAKALPTVSSDRLTYDFSLRKDATFSDGRPVTGEDFIFYLKAIKNPYITNAIPLRWHYSRIERLELIDGDPYRLRAVMTEPYYLAVTFIGNLCAFPKHIWDPTGISDRITFSELNDNDPEGNPAITQMADLIEDEEKGFDPEYLIASGPYMFERHGSFLTVLARNPKYWNKAHKYGRALPDRVIYRVFLDTEVAIEGMKHGELDFIPVIEKSLFQRERQELPAHLKTALYDYPSYSYIGYNQESPIFKEKLVRQAMSYAMNRDRIIDEVYFGMARPVQSPIFHKRPEADTTIPIIRYDIAKSKELLAQAGWNDTDGDGILDKVIDGEKTDFRFKIVLNSGNRRREQIGMIFSEELKKLGIEAEIVRLEWATFLDRTRDGEYEAMIAGWAMSPVEGDMYQIWHSASAKDGGSNHIRYRSPEVDRLIERIRGEFDFNKRKDLYRQIQRIIHEDQPYTFLISEKQTGLYNDRLGTIEFFNTRPCYNPAFWKVRTGK